MGKEMWYVIQVRTGLEEEVKTQCEKLVDHVILKRCFIPYYKSMKKYLGEWHIEEKTLFPGYVFLITDNVEKLFIELKKVFGLTKLIGAGEEFIPLNEKEIEFLTLCGKERMIVDISTGVIEDGGLKILKGPLKGMEECVKKIDRHKRKAYLEVEMAGVKMKTQVGVEIVEKG